MNLHPLEMPEESDARNEYLWRNALDSADCCLRRSREANVEAMKWISRAYGYRAQISPERLREIDDERLAKIRSDA